MIAFRVAEEWLDFNASLGLEIRSPLFGTATVPGIQSYPSGFEDTPRNRRLLGFPALRSRQVGPVPPVVADCYLGGTLWRRGLLRYEYYDSDKNQYQYKFEADADALATRIDGVKLSELEQLGDLAIQFTPETDDYVFFPVRNAAFYGDKAPLFGGVVNHYGAGGYTRFINYDQHTYTPFPKVVALLRRGLEAYGYTLTGDWVADPEMQQLVLYSTRSLDAVTGYPEETVAWRELLPEVRIADLLIVLQQFFCLGYLFNPVRREVEIRPLRDIIREQGYQQRTARGGWRDVASDVDGFTLGFTTDSGDEQLKNFVWPQVLVGNGKEEIRPAADTLRMVQEEDPLTPGRQWLVPVAEQQGTSFREGYDMQDNRLGQLRFLFYRGLQPDTAGGTYPLGTSGTVNALGQSVGNYALRWDGPQGLYETWHRDWLAFRSNARVEERKVPLTLSEFRQLDPATKDMVDGLKFLWERISLSVGGENGTIGEARVTYHQTLL